MIAKESLPASTKTKESLSVPKKIKESLPNSVKTKESIPPSVVIGEPLPGASKLYRIPVCFILAIATLSCASYFMISYKFSIRDAYLFMLVSSFISFFIQCAFSFILDFLSYKKGCKQKKCSIESDSPNKNLQYEPDGKICCASLIIAFSYFITCVAALMYTATKMQMDFTREYRPNTIILYFVTIFAILVFTELFMLFALSYIDDRRINYHNSAAYESDSGPHLYTSPTEESQPESSFNASLHNDNQHIKGKNPSNDQFPNDDFVLNDVAQPNDQDLDQRPNEHRQFSLDGATGVSQFCFVSLI